MAVSVARQRASEHTGSGNVTCYESVRNETGLQEERNSMFWCGKRQFKLLGKLILFNLLNDM
ncbi:uncharacterized protein SETTUDRAFT_164319 [Exserohilum turcica Et28A]|uniref:Uncharacterized protein n=1 Tax=Exserohilum turcicum (strain 28A) TaxID=671987 RepID=R0K306_EXST2|nr:uncharacterized protein SETTUDRAFT_164319 [Exserohilum turcica Et28A]EOA83989.1 hypothetical protein SETTUDRAFT_164319 [Exserohilum turcica Et28A]